jgi:hypothetical protein
MRIEMTQKQSLYLKYQCSPNDTWAWNYAQWSDVEDMYLMAKSHFEREMDGIFTINDEAYKYALDISTSHQRHNLALEQLLVCRDKTTNKLLAYSWIGRGHRTPYSNDEMAEARMAHTDLNLSPTQRIHILVQMISYWETWCKACGIPVLVSTSIREEQATFLKLHERLGFVVRGGICYKRLIPKEEIK